MFDSFSNLLSGSFAVGHYEPGGLDIGDVIHWLEARRVDGQVIVYIEGGTILAVPRNPRNNNVATVSNWADGLAKIVGSDCCPCKNIAAVRQMALGFAQQCASVESVGKKGSQSEVSIRQACGKHAAYHKLATVRCTATDRLKVTGDKDITEQFTFILHHVDHEGK